MMKQYLLLSLMIIGCAVVSELYSNNNNIRILILSGSSNHNWQTTTPYIEQIFANDKSFYTTTTCAPDTLNDNFLDNIDVIVSNRNVFPETSENWTPQAKNALIKFMQRGGGFVTIHAASATHYDWPEYFDIVGATWGDKTHHGPIEEFKVIINDKKHPITVGINNFMITDELWIDLEQKGELDTLCYAISNENGIKKREAVAMTVEIDQGRSFYLVLGHDTTAMASKEWQQLLLRGTKWAADK